MKKSGLFFILIIILSFLLNVAGINWGVPSVERNKIYFQSREDISKVLSGISETKVVKSKTEYKEELSGARFNPLRSYHPDESQFIESLSNINIKKLDLNPHYFYYGTLFFWFFGAFLGIASLFGFVKLATNLDFFYTYPQELAKFYITGRMISVIFAVLTVFIVFLIARKIYDEKKGLISALFLALTPLFVINAHYIAVDIMETFFITLTLFFALKVFESDRNKWYIFAGISAGLAGSTKYPGILSIFFIPVAYFLNRSYNWKNFFFCFFRKKVLLAYFCTAVTFIVVFPFIITNNNEVMSYIKIVKGTDWNFFGSALFYLKALYYGMGWPLLVISFVGLLVAFKKKEKKELLLAFWIVFSFIFFVFSVKKMDRYILVIIPFLLILASRSIQLFKNKFLQSIILIFVVLFSFLYTSAYDLVFMRENVRTSAGKWIAENVDSNSSIGLRRDPFQYEIPPLNMEKYRIYITGKEKKDVERSLETNRPEYFILSEAEVPRNLKFWEDVITGKNYVLLKKFYSPPEIFGIKFNCKNPSEDYLYIYPKIYSLKRM